MQVLFFVLGIMIRLCDTEGADAIHALLDAEVDDSCYHLVGVIGTAMTVQFCMLFAALSVVLVPLGMLIKQLFFSRSTPILRIASTMEPPVVLLGKGERYHLFLSHVWSTGQDQCAVIKRQLQLLLPGVVIFLDIDGTRPRSPPSHLTPSHPLRLPARQICRTLATWRAMCARRA